MSRATPTIEEFMALQSRVDGLEHLLADLVADLSAGAAPAAAARIEAERYSASSSIHNERKNDATTG